MLPGFNTNIRRRGTLFHVQTEDSGRARPHVITHLFHAGTILASEKTGYADELDGPDLERAVRTRMESQHKAMLLRLRRGELDEEIVRRLGEGAFADAAGTPTDLGHETVTDTPGPSDATGSVTTEASATIDEADASAPAGARAPEPPAVALLDAAPASRADGKPLDAGAPLDELVLDWLVARARRARRPRP